MRSEKPKGRGRRGAGAREGDADAVFAAELARRKAESVGQLLFRAARLWNERALAQVRDLGLPNLRLAHTALLPHLDLGGTRLVDLAARAGITKQAAAELVAELEAMGLVVRRPDPEDRRAKRLSITEAGRRGFFTGLRVLVAMEKELDAELGPGTMEELRATLAALVGVLERSPDRAPSASPPDEAPRREVAGEGEGRAAKGARCRRRSRAGRA